jgi:hypothetical protein
MHSMPLLSIKETLRNSDYKFGYVWYPVVGESICVFSLDHNLLGIIF